MPMTVGVCGRLSISDLRPSKTGLTGVILLMVEGVGDEVGFLETPTGGMGLSGVAHSPCSTDPPERHIASSASSACMYATCLVFASCALERSPLSSSGESSWLTRAVFLIDFARIPNRRVDKVSASLYAEGEQLMIRVVRELPPSDSCRIRVSFESRYGICFAWNSNQC